MSYGSESGRVQKFDEDEQVGGSHRSQCVQRLVGGTWDGSWNAVVPSAKSESTWLTSSLRLMTIDHLPQTSKSVRFGRSEYYEAEKTAVMCLTHVNSAIASVETVILTSMFTIGRLPSICGEESAIRQACQVDDATIRLCHDIALACNTRAFQLGFNMQFLVMHFYQRLLAFCSVRYVHAKV